MSGTGSVILVNDPGVAGNTSSGPFANVPPATLQQWLLEAQLALHKLNTGQQKVTISYGEGSGQKSATYQRTDKSALLQHIKQLNLALGTPGAGRRALLVGF